MKQVGTLNSLLVICTLIFLVFSIIGCSSNDNYSHSGQDLSYPIDPDVKTTVERTVTLATDFTGTIVPQDLFKVWLYDQYGYGVWTYGPGLEVEIRTDIAPDYSDGLAADQLKLLSFFTISDIHITDKEAPNQLIYLQQLTERNALVTSVYSPVMLYTTHVLDAAIQTINVLHERNPFDFGISLGDTCNSTQYNELRWYLDVIDGKNIVPSSGAHAGASDIDYQKPYKAAGIDKSIPWYQVFGNHDHFFIGSFPVDANNLRETYTSDKIFATGDLLANPLNLHRQDYYMGVIDGSSPYGNILYAGDFGSFSSPPTVTADPDRRSLTKSEWIKEFFDTTSNPIGHGFNIADAENGFACYSFVPKSDLPLKIIVLDNVQIEDDNSPDIHGHGFLTQERWEWLKQELASGQAEDQLMIIASHVPIGVMPQGSEMEWWVNPHPGPDSPPNAVDILGLITEFQKHPNLLMLIAGHRHFNTVKAFASMDPAHPENGFWQVETSSLRDFPQQFRTFDIFLNSDNTISIRTINVDTSVKEGTPAAKSRKYAVAAQQIVNNNLNLNLPNSDPTLPPNTNDPSIVPMNTKVYSYNAELVKQLSPRMREKLAELRSKR